MDQIKETNLLSLSYGKIIKKDIETERITQDAIIQNFITAERRGLNEDIRKRMSAGTIQLGSGTPEISDTAPQKRTVKGLLRGVVSRG